MKSSDKGFTLTELMIAMGILLIVISGLMSTFIYCILLNESNNNLVTAANDAQYVLEQIKARAYGDIDDFINNFNPNHFSNLNNETITFPGTSIGASIATITVNVSWTERQRQRTFQLSTYVAFTG
jgi:prepilin-type N-terminal cleavage/methylation domain-containing protein